MKKYLLLFLLLLSFSGFAQSTINNYKYVIVPEKYSFLKQKDQYKLNTLTKNLLQDHGFTVYFDNPELPNEIFNNKCSALNLDVVEKNSMFSTNLTLVLKDCKGNILFKSKEGKSREKEYNISYNLALRDAFTSLDAANYAYTAPTETPVQQNVATGTVITPVAKAITTDVPQAAGTLYAQPTANGYQLIDTAPKIILTLLKTSVADYFIANNTSANGIVFKKNETWVFEYYKDGQLITEKMLIKF